MFFALVPWASIPKVSPVTSALPRSPQAPGGAAGEHEEEHDGERPLPVSALRRTAWAAGQHLGLLSGLQKGGFSHTGSACS